MSFGTLYTHKPNPRSTAILAIAKASGLHLDIIYAEKDNKDAYEALCTINPLGQVPTFVGADGYVLTECISIALYITSRSDTTTLLGSCQRDHFDILKWMSFANSEFIPSIGGCILPLFGRRQQIRSNSEDCLRAMHLNCKLTDNHLKTSRYLVGDRLTIADFFMVGMLYGGFMVFHKVLHTEYPSLTRWYYEVYNEPMYKEVAGDIHLLDVPYPTLPAEESNSTVKTTDKQVELRQETTAVA